MMRLATPCNDILRDILDYTSTLELDVRVEFFNTAKKITLSPLEPSLDL